MDKFIPSENVLAIECLDGKVRWYPGMRKICLIGGYNDGNIFYVNTNGNGELDFMDWKNKRIVLKMSEEGIKFKFVDIE